MYDSAAETGGQLAFCETAKTRKSGSVPHDPSISQNGSEWKSWALYGLAAGFVLKIRTVFRAYFRINDRKKAQ